MDPITRIASLRAKAERDEATASVSRAAYYQAIADHVADVGASQAARDLDLARSRIYELIAKARRDG